jgi:hypothetical protein
MNLEITPGVGVLPLEFGMTVAQVRRAIPDAWVDSTTESNDAGYPQLRVELLTASVDIFIHFEYSDAVTSVEIWRPETGDDGSVPWALVFAGMDLFGSPADEIIRAVRLLGFTVDVTEELRPRATNPSLSLGFNRDGGEFVNDDSDDGVAKYFNSVLIAIPGYFDGR